MWKFSLVVLLATSVNSEDVNNRRSWARAPNAEESSLPFLSSVQGNGTPAPQPNDLNLQLPLLPSEGAPLDVPKVPNVSNLPLAPSDSGQNGQPAPAQQLPQPNGVNLPYYPTNIFPNGVSPSAVPPSNGSPYLPNYNVPMNYGQYPAPNMVVPFHVPTQNSGPVQRVPPLVPSGSNSVFGSLNFGQLSPQLPINPYCKNTEVLLKVWTIFSNLLDTGGNPVQTPDADQIKFALILIKKYLEEAPQNAANVDIARKLLELETDLLKNKGVILKDDRPLSSLLTINPVQVGPSVSFKYELPTNMRPDCRKAFLRTIETAQEAYRNLAKSPVCTGNTDVSQYPNNGYLYPGYTYNLPVDPNLNPYGSAPGSQIPQLSQIPPVSPIPPVSQIPPAKSDSALITILNYLKNHDSRNPKDLEWNFNSLPTNYPYFPTIDATKLPPNPSLKNQVPVLFPNFDLPQRGILTPNDLSVDQPQTPLTNPPGFNVAQPQLPFANLPGFNVGQPQSPLTNPSGFNAGQPQSPIANLPGSKVNQPQSPFANLPGFNYGQPQSPLTNSPGFNAGQPQLPFANLPGFNVGQPKSPLTNTPDFNVGQPQSPFANLPGFNVGQPQSPFANLPGFNIDQPKSPLTNPPGFNVGQPQSPLTNLPALNKAQPQPVVTIPLNIGQPQSPLTNPTGLNAGQPLSPLNPTGFDFGPSQSPLSNIPGFNVGQLFTNPPVFNVGQTQTPITFAPAGYNIGQTVLPINSPNLSPTPQSLFPLGDTDISGLITPNLPSQNDFPSYLKHVKNIADKLNALNPNQNVFYPGSDFTNLPVNFNTNPTYNPLDQSSNMLQDIPLGNNGLNNAYTFSTNPTQSYVVPVSPPVQDLNGMYPGNTYSPDLNNLNPHGINSLLNPYQNPYQAPFDNTLLTNPNNYQLSPDKVPTNDLNTIANFGKLNPNTKGEIELTYVLKRPKALVYQPFYFVKYRLPYNNFVKDIGKLMSQNSLRTSKADLYKNLIEMYNASEIPPDLAHLPKEQVKDMVIKSGALVNARLIPSNDTEDKRLAAVEKMINKINLTNHVNGMPLQISKVGAKNSRVKRSFITDTGLDGKPRVEFKPSIYQTGVMSEPLSNLNVGLGRHLHKSPSFDSSISSSLLDHL